ncbi:MAG: hypothetical protein IKA32_00125 [Lentisphaeria bacterium]|nr:hypothetical protein [Lentisphaeria bacterium]
MPKKHKLLKIFLCLSVLIVILFAGTVYFTAAAVFSHPKQLPPVQLKMQDIKLQQKIIQRLAKDVFRSRPRPTGKLTLKPEELQSLFRLIDFVLTMAKMTGKYEGMDVRSLEPEFSNGYIKMVYPLDTGYSWLFGGVLRFSFTGTPSFAGQEITVLLKDSKIGRLPLPGKFAKMVLQNLLTEFYESKGYETFRSLIKEIKMNTDGTLVIIYYPAKLAPVLMF